MDDDGQIWFGLAELRVDTTGRDPEIRLGNRQIDPQRLRAEAAELLSVVALVDAIAAAKRAEES